MSELRDGVVALTHRVDELGDRVGRLEAGFLQLNVRVDGLADDMRQRFRVVNERLAELAA